MVIYIIVVLGILWGGRCCSFRQRIPWFEALGRVDRGFDIEDFAGIEFDLADRVEIPESAHAISKKVAGLIKGLLAAEIIRPSTSPRASPIVIVRKSNGVDTRLCIDYKLVNNLTRLMVYPMPLISDLLDNLDKALWYCLLGMTSGFWVVPMTDRAREISAFITSFGLFEGSRMLFGLKNVPQIYQRLVDNALSYIDDITIAAESWDQMCQRLEDLLEACDKWNLSIRVTKSFWGMDKVGYLGHRVSIGGLEANPKDLKSLTDLSFPGSLRSMQSFLDSLNYYSRFIEDYAIYASILYELREVEFAELEKRSDLRNIMDQNDPIARDHGPPELPLAESVDESFDGFARVKRGGGTFIAIVWSLPGWEVVKARSGYLESLAVNEAKYNGLILGLEMLENLDHKRLVVYGDSNFVIRQRKALDRLRKWSDHELVHVKRDWNRSTDSLASAVLQRQGGTEVQKGPGYQDLVTFNRLDEILIPRIEKPVVRVAAVTTRGSQEEEVWIAGMKKYLSGAITDLTQAEARSYGKIAADYEVDEQDLLFYCLPTPRSGDDRDRLLRLVVPETLQSDVLHHYHTTLEGGHQGRYVGECVGCETGKGKPVIRGESSGNLQATFPFQIIAIDHIPSLPRSHKGNTELLIWVDLFTEYVIATASSSRSAQTVAESTRLDLGFGYLDRVREGYARKLAHLWHGPFRVANNINEFRIKLEIAGTGYQIFPVIHVSKLKLVKDFPDRPRVELTVNESDRFDFDEIVLPEDGWVPDLGADEYEVERISDVRRYDDPTWVDEADLNLGAMLNAFLRERANRNRFNVMQSHEEM
ncbi:reverse transcriptase [Phytophthora megakarya]|uniref:Reverse transcriptase n=1 Tax=Phytophthora megakarya TaxID=4795 RepID=A0A225VI46_9STRA|nr:reverse transcriptase [Phytophthora megakarya]